MTDKHNDREEELAVIRITKFQVKRWLVLGLFFYLTIFFLVRVRVVLLPFITAFILAYIVNPLVKGLYEKGVQRVVAILLIFAMVFSLLLSFFVFAYPIIINELDNLSRSIPGYLRDIEKFVNKMNQRYSEIQLPYSVRQVLAQGFDKLEAGVINLIEGITQLILGTLSRLLTLLIAPVLAFYFLKDQEKIGESFLSLVPHSYRKDVQVLAEDVNRVFSGFLRGQLFVSLIVGSLTTIALYLLNIKYYFILGLVAATFNIIPFLGPILGGIPPVIFALLQGPWRALILIVILAFIQQVESGLISPKVMSTQVGLHPVTVIFALFAGGELFGLLGLILAVPAFGIMKVVLIFIWERLVEDK
ncbi:MAG: AI-2E family transporter [Halanaerobium sp.]|nr:AI-2E family transporter [Halanaerobium sp.]